jgi:hypothetical protein
MTEPEPYRCSSALPVIVLTRPEAQPDADWQELDRGPGVFHVPEGHVVRVRLKSIDDAGLYALAAELQDVEPLRFLDLAENRNVTNDGLKHLRGLKQLTGLNLSSCSITGAGLEHLRPLTRLAHLNLSYCNRLSDRALKTIESLRPVTFVDLQGCLSITKAAFARVRRRDLTINR